MQEFTLRTDGGTQPRASLDEDIVERYREDMASGLWDWARSSDPPVAYYDGTDHWLAEGFHRLEAATRAGKLDEFAVVLNIRQGTQRDAILHSVGANAQHGLPRSPEDKRRAVMRLLEDPEWGKWSDREIARRCYVTHPFVAKLRTVTGAVSSERTYTTKHGTTATMDTGAIGKTKPPAEGEPPAIKTPQPVPPITTAAVGPLRLDPGLPGDRAAADRPLDADAAGDEAQTYLDRLREAAQLAKALNPGYREDALREHRRLRNLFLKFDRGLRALERQVGAPGRNKKRAKTQALSIANATEGERGAAAE